MYSVRDYKLAAKFVRQYAEWEKSGKLAKIADMLEWACVQLDKNNKLEGETNGEPFSDADDLGDDL